MVSIGVIGDYNASNVTHTTIADALSHTGSPHQCTWIPTGLVSDSTLAAHDGICCAPGSPYRSLTGALEAIRWARERGVPFLGTCAGFQHAIVEVARNVIGNHAAASAEYDAGSPALFIDRLVCSLVGKRMTVHLAPGSQAYSAYGVSHADEDYYCNFGLNPGYESDLENVGIRFSGRDQDGEVRIFEFADHPFFMGTLFVPQTSSTPGRAHPVIAAFMRAVIAARERGSVGFSRRTTHI